MGSVSNPNVQSVGGAVVVDFGVRVGLNVGLVLELRVVVEVGDAVGAIRGATSEILVTTGREVVVDIVVLGRAVLAVRAVVDRGVVEVGA